MNGRAQNDGDEDNGFFLTGVNTGQIQMDEMDEQEEQIAQQQPVPNDNDFDPADRFKHIAIADCSKAFSN